jgi:hypothetical protein
LDPNAQPSDEPLAKPQRRLAWLRDEPGNREMWALGLLLTLLSGLPFLTSWYPQMVDYAAHLARFHIMLERDSNPVLQEYYGFDWRWMGNLGADILIRPLARVMPLETAGWLIAALLPLINGLAILTVEWTLRKRIGLASMLAFAFIWSPSLLLGFLNFMISQALALFAFALWVKLDGSRWRGPLFLPIGLVVWLAHVSGWGILGLMVFGYEWHKDKSWRAFLAPWPLFLPFVALLSGGTVGEPPSYGPRPEIYKWAIWKQAMRGTLQYVDYAHTILICLILLVSLLFKRWDWRLGWAALMMLALSLAMPRHIFGGDLVDARMISAGLMVGCMSLTWKAPRWLLLAAAALFVGRLGYTTMDWSRDSRETAELLKALDGLPQGVKIASYMVTERREWGFNSQEHICGYAVVRKDALINCNFAVPGIHMMTIKEGGGFFRDPFHKLNHRAGKPIDTYYYEPAMHTDWFWYMGQTDPVRLAYGYEKARSGRHWILAKRVKKRLD